MPLRSNPADWADARHRAGADGEEAAQCFLKRHGWRILVHRFRMGRVEVDLVARRGTVVAFVEVKTRLTEKFGSPLQAVTWSKQREIGRVAQAWIDRHGRLGDTYRFDVIGITRLRDGSRRIEHVADAFRLARP
jgi:putative endonuclease